MNEPHLSGPLASTFALIKQSKIPVKLTIKTLQPTRTTVNHRTHYSYTNNLFSLVFGKSEVQKNIHVLHFAALTDT